MTLPAMEFIRRFLQHVPPKGFHKVRYYGLLSSANRPLLRQVQLLLANDATVAKTEKDADCPNRSIRCRFCGKGFMVVVGSSTATPEETFREIAAMINFCCSRLTTSRLRTHVQKVPSRVNGQVRPNWGNCHIFLNYADLFSLATTLFMTDICRISGYLSLDLIVATPYT
jgi:hypothetical protein